jgi:sulfur dioxygenase
MLLRQLIDSASSTYTYLLGDERTGEAVLVDPVFEQHARDAALVRELGLTLRYTLDTHCHADHVTGAWLMKEALGSRIVLAAAVGAENVDVAVGHGDVVRFGDTALEVRATPGHTDGCVTYVRTDFAMAFTGDALLIRGAGRTDFQQGDARRLFRSIKEQIFTLPDTCLVYPGHDYSGRTVSSVGEERAHNARVGGAASEGDFVGYMENLALPHPKKIDIAVPANMRCGRPEGGVRHQAPSWGPVVVTYAGLPEIDPHWVADHRDAVHVLDVRGSDEYDGELGHIAGAQLVPLPELRARVNEVPRDRPVVTVCRSGRRSGQATVILREAGRTDVANVAGGMLRWRELRLP